MKSPYRMRLLGTTACFASLMLALVGEAQPKEDRAADEPSPPAEETSAKASDTAPEAGAPADEGGRTHVEGQSRPEIVRFGNDTTVREGEEVGQLVLIFGSAKIDGRVHGNVVVVGGGAKVTGHIDENLVVPFGSVELGPQARVGENLVVGGSLKADPDARVGGEVFSWSAIEENVPLMAGAKRWIVHGLILGRPLPHQPGWWWGWAFACAIVYLVTALIFNRPIAASVGTLESRPVGSFFVGVLMFVLFVPLLVFLAATGVGLVVVPFVFCGAAVAFVFGKITVYRMVGEQVGKQSGLSFLERPIVALIAGIAILYFAYMVPVVGFLIWGIAAPLGFGAVILSAFRAFRSEGNKQVVGVAATPPAPATTVAGLEPPLIGSAGANLPVGDITLLPRAGFWIRSLATFLDLLLVGTLALVVHVPSVTLLMWVAYHIGMWTWRGTTIGGVVLGIKLVRRDGRPVDFPVALVRSLASFFSALVLFLGFFWAGWNREKLSWHDMIAGTVVVRIPKGISLL